MAQTLRKKVERWSNEWLKLYLKGKQTESQEMYVARKAIEDYQCQQTAKIN